MAPNRKRSVSDTSLLLIEIGCNGGCGGGGCFDGLFIMYLSGKLID